MKSLIKIKKRKNYYLASCPIFGIHAQGKTIKEAKDSLVEALCLALVTSYDCGTLDKFIKDVFQL